MKFSPFRLTRRSSISTVGNEETGYFYFLKRGDITPVEDIGDEAQKQQEITLLYYSAADVLAEKEKISKVDALSLLASSSDVGQFDLRNYITSEQMVNLVKLQEENKATPIKAATMMIRYRTAYPVVLTARAGSGATKLSVEPLRVPLVEGDKIRFGDLVASVKAAELDTEEITLATKLPVALEPDKVGFLLDFETGKERIGYEEWTEEQTKELLTREQINAIYDFYLEEVGIPKAQEAQSGNVLTTTLSESENSLDKPSELVAPIG